MMVTVHMLQKWTQQKTQNLTWSVRIAYCIADQLIFCVHVTFQTYIANMGHGWKQACLAR